MQSCSYCELDLAAKLICLSIIIYFFIQVGVYVHGLFLDGAGWSRRTHCLCESANKVLYTQMPVIHIYAINSTEPKAAVLYECPVYKKADRTGLNFITPLWLPTSPLKTSIHWIMRGVALLCDIK